MSPEVVDAVPVESTWVLGGGVARASVPTVPASPIVPVVVVVVIEPETVPVSELPIVTVVV